MLHSRPEAGKEVFLTNTFFKHQKSMGEIAQELTQKLAEGGLFFQGASVRLDLGGRLAPPEDICAAISNYMVIDAESSRVSLKPGDGAATLEAVFMVKSFKRGRERA